MGVGVVSSYVCAYEHVSGDVCVRDGRMCEERWDSREVPVSLWRQDSGASSRVGGWVGKKGVEEGSAPLLAPNPASCAVWYRCRGTWEFQELGLQPGGQTVERGTEEVQSCTLGARS